MSRVVILGGTGGIGSIAARALALGGFFDEVIVADLRTEAADALASALTAEGAHGVGGTAFDATDDGSVHDVIDGADVVVNCVGPFYRFGPPLLEAAIRSGVAYVDVCDDLDATVRQLELDAAARDAGVTALIGMGNSPGLANVFARLCADDFLDAVESVDIMHIHGGEPEEGAAVVKHRIHAMTNDVPLFVDGEFVQVRMLEASGEAFIRQTEFRDVGNFPVYPYPHPETITLPRHMPGLRRATNLGVVFPLSYFELTKEMVRLGLCDDRPLTVQGAPVVPIEFAVAHILRERPRLLAEAGVTGPGGCLKVVVGGRSGGEPHGYTLSLSSTAAGAGEGTGIPAALGAVLMQRGQVKGPGVVPPEAAVQPHEMLALAGEVVGHFGMGGGVPIHVEHTRPDGTTEELALSLG